LVDQSDASKNRYIYRLDTATGMVWKLMERGFRRIEFEGGVPEGGETLGRYFLFKQSDSSKNRDLVLIDTVTGLSWRTREKGQGFKKTRTVLKFLPDIT